MTEFNATIGADNAAIKDKASNVKDAVADLAGAAKNYTAHRASDARDAASQFVDTAKTKIVDANDNVIDYVQRNPFTAIGIAVGIGFVAGLILKRR